MNTRATTRNTWKSVSEEVAVNTCRQQLNVMYSSCKDVLSELDMMYSHGWRKKEYVMMIMYHLACKDGTSEYLAMLSIFQGIGGGWALLGLMESLP